MPQTATISFTYCACFRQVARSLWTEANPSPLKSSQDTSANRGVVVAVEVAVVVVVGVVGVVGVVVAVVVVGVVVTDVVAHPNSPLP